MFGTEDLWGGRFGNEYTERNARAGALRGPFWARLVEKYDLRSVLEIGCNRGANLKWIAERIPRRNVYGVDVNDQALAHLHQELPGVQALWAKADHLPFHSGLVGLAFTCGVLIHQPLEKLGEVIGEMKRVSHRYLLAMEYHAPKRVELEYRGHAGALWKDDYASYFGLAIIEEGALGKESGFDDLSYWLMEKA